MKQELCKCKKFSGYTLGYICRICKKPIYSEQVKKEIELWEAFEKEIEGGNMGAWRVAFGRALHEYGKFIQKIPDTIGGE